MIITNCRRIISCYKFTFLELLAVKINFFNRLLMKWRKPIFLNEIEMAKVTSKDNILLIGCGIFPSETMLIAEQTKAKITGIDNSINAVKIARKYVQKEGLSNLVKIEHADGINYPVKDFDVVFIAINVWPINSVLKHLSKNMKKNARIMCKSIKNDIPDVLETLGLTDTFYITDKLENPRTQSFLLTKNNKQPI